MTPTRFWMRVAMLPLRRTATGCSSVSVALRCLLVGSVSVEATNHMTCGSSCDSRHDVRCCWMVALAFAAFCLHTLAVISVTAMLVVWALRNTRSPALPTQRIGTDRVRLVAYWDMELVRLQGVAREGLQRRQQRHKEVPGLVVA